MAVRLDVAIVVPLLSVAHVGLAMLSTSLASSFVGVRYP